MITRATSILSLALAACAITVAAGAVQCASHQVALENEGKLTGTLNDRKVAVRTALLSASDIGELVVAVADIDYSCADSEVHRVPPPYTGFIIHLADISAATAEHRLRLPPPAHAGVYEMAPFLDYRAGWFQRRGDPPRPGVTGTPLPDGSYSTLLSQAGGTLPREGGKGVNWPVGVSGQVTLGSFPKSAGELVPVTIDVVVESGERLRGTFQAVACKKALDASQCSGPCRSEPRER